jgi:ring-1,2-phenylacetyl-CoA epoxidase subunit PaaD
VVSRASALGAGERRGEQQEPAATALAAADAREICASVPDPELPVVTIGDLGILRDVRVDTTGRVEVVVTPTYSGCPATEVIRDDIRAALRHAGFGNVAVRTVLSPAWTTDWITETGRRKLAAHGIAPPGAARLLRPAVTIGVPSAGIDRAVVDVDLAVRCPQCGSVDTVVVSRFGSTACQAMYRCTSCREPFNAIKPH